MKTLDSIDMYIIASVAAVPFAIWKLVDIVVWVVKNVTVSIGK